MRIAIVDLEIGNLRSVEQALLAVGHGASVSVTRDRDEIDRADKIVLPGQGAVGTWFTALDKLSLRSSMEDAFGSKPVLGICVGMQAMFKYCAEDGGIEGMGLFDGSVQHFDNFHQEEPNVVRKIPQMGWNKVSQTHPHPLWHGIDDDSYFYFVHSYCANLYPDVNDDVVFGTADYGHEFIAAVGRENVFAVQFHPEKSHNDGLQLLENFCQWNGSI